MLKELKKLLLNTHTDPFPKFADDLGVQFTAREIAKQQDQKLREEVARKGWAEFLEKKEALQSSTDAADDAIYGPEVESF